MDGINNISRLSAYSSQTATVRPVTSANNPQQDQNRPGQGADRAPNQASAVAAAKYDQVRQEKNPARKEGADLYQKFLSEVSELFAEQASHNRLRIDLHDEAGRFVYKVVNVETDEVTYQFPAEEMLKMLSYYRENAAGLILDDEA